MQNGTALLIENLSDLSEGRIVKEDKGIIIIIWR